MNKQNQKFFIVAMAEQNDTGHVKNSVPSSPVVKNVSFLNRTPTPSGKATQWVQGAPTPIRKGQLTPMSEALKLLVGFSTGEVTMEGENMKHLPTISESLDTIWETPKRKSVDGSANRTKKAKTAQKEPRKGLTTQRSCMKVPNSKIKLKNITRGSPLLASQSANLPRGKGKGKKGVRLNDSSFTSGMARQKKTLTAKQRLQ